MSKREVFLIPSKPDKSPLDPRQWLAGIIRAYDYSLGASFRFYVPLVGSVFGLDSLAFGFGLFWCFGIGIIFSAGRSNVSVLLGSCNDLSLTQVRDLLGCIIVYSNLRVIQNKKGLKLSTR